MMTGNKEIKPCPFCGCKSIKKWTDKGVIGVYGKRIKGFHVQCTNCAA